MTMADAPAAPASRRVPPDGDQGGDQGAIPARPETLIREYRHAGEYQRDAARLQRAGWEVVSVLERPAVAGWLSWMIGGRPGARSGPRMERLVTYVWRGREHQAGLPSTRSAGLRAAGSLRWWWLALVIGLVLLLALGLLSFLGDDLLPDLLALAV